MTGHCSLTQPAKIGQDNHRLHFQRADSMCQQLGRRAVFTSVVTQPGETDVHIWYMTSCVSQGMERERLTCWCMCYAEWWVNGDELGAVHIPLNPSGTSVRLRTVWHS